MKLNSFEISKLSNYVFDGVAHSKKTFRNPNIQEVIIDSRDFLGQNMKTVIMKDGTKYENAANIFLTITKPNGTETIYTKITNEFKNLLADAKGVKGNWLDNDAGHKLF